MSARHIEWPLPTERPALAQGAVAGVPAKVWLPDGTGAGRVGDVLLLTATAYADELTDRLPMSEYTETLLADPLADDRRSRATTS